MNESLFYPERMGRIILLAMEEVLGSDGIRPVLHLASFADPFPAVRSDKTFSFEMLTRLMEALERAYGVQGGRGAALRIGRACFQYGLREYGPMLGFTEMAFRLLPLSSRLRLSARSFADLFNQYTDQRVRIEDQQDRLLWHIERCPVCWQRRVSQPSCHLAVGLLQESLYWLSSGKIFNVEEIACIARGDPACTIAIERTPIS